MRVRLLLVLCLALGFATSAYAQGNGRLQIHFIDVGQGDAALLVTPGGETVLFDNGVLNQCDRPLAYLQRAGVQRIDYHIASHYHADHIGCTDVVLGAFPLQHAAFDRGGSYTTQTYTRYVATVGALRRTAPIGTSIPLEGGVALDFIAANGAGVPGADDENDLSVVVRVRYGVFEAVFGGDLSGVTASGYQDIESYVAPAIGQVEVLKVNHHASRYSSNATWLATLRPKVGVVSIGAANPYGHPTADAMTRLHQAGVRTYWTSMGAGVSPDPAWDLVAGNTVIEVAPGANAFTVAAFGQTVPYQVWNTQGGSPPGAPIGLTGSVNGNTVSLNWLAPTTGGVPTSYRVEAAFTPNGPLLATLSVPGTSLTVPNVPNGTYYVRVRAVNTDGSSDASNEVALVVPSGGGGGCSTAPNPPQGLTGSAVANTVNLAWNAPGGGCPSSSYAVQAGSGPGLSNITTVNVGLTTSLSASAPNGTYYIRIAAQNSFGTSAPSNEVAVTVGTTCQLPTAPVLLSPGVNGTTVSLSWLAAVGTVTGYRVEAGSSPSAFNLLYTSAGGTSYIWSAAPGGTHYIRVRAFNSCGTGPASNEVTATVAAAPPPPPPPGDCGPRAASCGQATAKCNDGTYSCSQNRSGTCSSHGGVACWICPGLLCG